jgi:hypothetical protein
VACLLLFTRHAKQTCKACMGPYPQYVESICAICVCVPEPIECNTANCQQTEDQPFIYEHICVKATDIAQMCGTHTQTTTDMHTQHSTHKSLPQEIASTCMQFSQFVLTRRLHKLPWHDFLQSHGRVWMVYPKVKAKTIGWRNF